MHQYLIHDTSGRKRGELCAFVRPITFNRLDQSDGADGVQVFHVFAGVVEFFEVVDTMDVMKNI